MIPEEWEVASISSLLVAPIQNGLFNEPSRKGRGCKLINVIDLYGSFPVETTGLERFAANKDELSRFAVRNGDMFFTRSSLTADGIAMCNVYEGDGEDPIVFDCHIIRVRPNTTRVEPLFLARSCGSRAARRYLVVNAKTTTMTTIDQSVIARLTVAVPPLPEQRAIADTLSDVDALLGALDRLIAKKRDIKQAAIQQLLTGQTRLPGFDGEWGVKRFGEVACPRRDRVDPRCSGVQDFCLELEHIASESGELLGSTSTGDQSSLKSVFRTGDVLFGKLRAYLRKYWLATRAGVCSTEIWVLTPKDQVITTAFLFQLIKSDEFIEAASNSYGTHMPRSDWSIVKNYEFKLPPLTEQIAIAKVLGDMDAELTALTQRRTKTRALKQAMMQELLTGRTRLV